MTGVASLILLEEDLSYWDWGQGEAPMQDEDSDGFRHWGKRGYLYIEGCWLSQKEIAC